MKIKIILFVEIYGHISRPRGSLCFNPWQILDIKFNFQKIRTYVIRKNQSTGWVILSSINMYQNAQQLRCKRQVSSCTCLERYQKKLHFLCKIYKDTAGVESSTIIYIERILVLCVIDKNTNWINGFEHLSCVPCRYMCTNILTKKT